LGCVRLGCGFATFSQLVENYHNGLLGFRCWLVNEEMTLDLPVPGYSYTVR
jgi:hypothetical protein